MAPDAAMNPVPDHELQAAIRRDKGGPHAQMMQRLLDALSAESARLDWLENEINTYGAINLHDGQHPRGHGLGLRPGDCVRTLREAIDKAMNHE